MLWAVIKLVSPSGSHWERRERIRGWICIVFKLWVMEAFFSIPCRSATYSCSPCKTNIVLWLHPGSLASGKAWWGASGGRGVRTSWWFSEVMGLTLTTHSPKCFHLKCWPWRTSLAQTVVAFWARRKIEVWGGFFGLWSSLFTFECTWQLILRIFIASLMSF